MFHFVIFRLFLFVCTSADVYPVVVFIQVVSIHGSLLNIKQYIIHAHAVKEVQFFVATSCIIIFSTIFGQSWINIPDFVLFTDFFSKLSCQLRALVMSVTLGRPMFLFIKLL